MAKCPFCKVPIDRLTEWYFWDVSNQIIICKDLHAKEYKYRILVVPYGQEWHKPWKQFTIKRKEVIIDSLNWVVMAHEKNGANFIKTDTEHFSIKLHGHAQACMK